MNDRKTIIADSLTDADLFARAYLRLKPATTVFVHGIGAVYVGTDQAQVDRLVRKYRDLLKMQVTVTKGGERP